MREPRAVGWMKYFDGRIAFEKYSAFIPDDALSLGWRKLYTDDALQAAAVEAQNQQARIAELDRELSKKAAANKALVKTLSRQQSKGSEFLQALKAYYSATVERNSTPYPEPDDRMRMAKAIDDTQAALFSLLDSSGSGWHE